MGLFRRVPAPQPAETRRTHPDGRTELRLQRIAGLRAAVTRQEAVITEMRLQLAAARDEQDRAARKLRGSRSIDRRDDFKVSMAAQDSRRSTALTAISEAEKAITALQETIAALAAELSDDDLAFL